MKNAVFVTQILLVFVLAGVAYSAAEKSPEIPASKFSSCSSKDRKQILFIIKPFSLARQGNDEKVPCTPGKGRFDQDGHVADETKWDDANKRCLLTKRYCFVGNEWAQIHEIKSDGQILKEEFAKIYKNQRSLILDQKVSASVSSLKEVKQESSKSAAQVEKSCESPVIKKQLEIEAKEDLVSKRHIADLKKSMKEEQAKIDKKLSAEKNAPNANWTKGEQPANQSKIQKEQIKIEKLEEADFAARKAIEQAHVKVESALKDKNASLEQKENLMKFEAKAIAAEKSAADALLKERKIVEKITQSSSQEKIQQKSRQTVQQTIEVGSSAKQKEQMKIETLENKEMETRKKLAQAHAKVEAVKSNPNSTQEEKKLALEKEVKAAQAEKDAVKKVIQETKKIENSTTSNKIIPKVSQQKKVAQKESTNALKKEQLVLEKLENKEISTRIAAKVADEKWNIAQCDPNISSQDKLKIVQADIEATKAAKAASNDVALETKKIQLITGAFEKKTVSQGSCINQDLAKEQVKLEKLENAELSAIRKAKIADAKLSEALKSSTVSSEEKLQLVNQDIAATKKVNEIQKSIKSETKKAEQMVQEKSQVEIGEKFLRKIRRTSYSRNCHCSGNRVQRRYIRSLKRLLHYLEMYEMDKREYYDFKTAQRGPCRCSH